MRRLLPLLLAVWLGACGFQLRGVQPLPFDTLHIALPENAELRVLLKRSIETTTPTRIVADAKQAQATLTITSDLPTKNILSLSSAGQVREYELLRTVTFRIHDADNRDYAPPGKIVIRRDLTYNESLVLAKGAEEALLWQDMQKDLVQQLQRRLAAIMPKREGS